MREEINIPIKVNFLLKHNLIEYQQLSELKFNLLYSRVVVLSGENGVIIFQITLERSEIRNE
jgi:hypothetical protein